MTVRICAPAVYASTAQVVVVGGGAAGLCAALALAERGIDALVLERDETPAGSTALSAGLVPAPGTRFQRTHDIVDDAQSYAADIRAKNHGQAEPAIVAMIAAEAGPVVEWLADAHGLPFTLVHDFDYPGHGARRMHGMPSRSGQELIDRLRSAAEHAGVTLIGSATATALLADATQQIHGVEITRPDGARDEIGCDALVLACNGYGGNAELVGRHIPEMAGALYFGHAGNRGEAVLWGAALGARLAHMSAYQGHGSVAQPHGILISWAAISEGGFQVDRDGRRFSDESLGYSEQAAKVLQQPDSIAWSVFDERSATIMRQFADFQSAEAAGAVIEATDVETLAARMRCPPPALTATFAEVERLKTTGGHDLFGRSFAGVSALRPPYRAVRVTGALFHTQGGLAVDSDARVLREDGTPFPNLFAAGGAAAGISGSTAAGYLSGNGLVTAIVLGRVAGRNACRQVRMPGRDEPIHMSRP